tara:strand:+ start:591 stop:890 length:300 start_codon:yes stop_codon:yes gene_type:complete
MKKRLWLDMIYDSWGNDIYWLRSTSDTTRIDPSDLYIFKEDLIESLSDMIGRASVEYETLSITHYDLCETSEVIAYLFDHYTVADVDDSCDDKRIEIKL